MVLAADDVTGAGGRYWAGNGADDPSLNDGCGTSDRNCLEACGHVPPSRAK